MLIGAGNDDADTAFLQAVDNALQREDAGNVDIGHPAHPQHHGARLGVDIGQCGFEFFHRTEEEGAVHDKHQHVIRQGGSIAAVFFLAHFHRFGHLADKVQGGQNHADVHRHHQIHQNGEEKGDEKQNIGSTLGAAQDVQAAFGLAHVPGYLKQDGSQRGQGNIGGQRCGHEQNQRQCEGVDDAGQRAVAALADVGGGAGDGAGGGEPAEKRRDDVGQPLAHQLLIGAVVRAGHAVGHHGGEQ